MFRIVCDGVIGSAMRVVGSAMRVVGSAMRVVGSAMRVVGRRASRSGIMDPEQNRYWSDKHMGLQRQEGWFGLGGWGVDKRASYLTHPVMF
jgi:hypothetical protein